MKLVGQIDVTRNQRQSAATYALENRLDGPNEVGTRFEPARSTHVGVKKTGSDNDRHPEDREGRKGLNETEATVAVRLF